MNIHERLQQASVPFFSVAESAVEETGSQKIISGKSATGKPTKFKTLLSATSSQEKMLAEMFFSLSLSLAKMSELRIAHQNITCENILLDADMLPHFSEFESAIEQASPELLFQDLKSLGSAMQKCIDPTRLEWVEDITSGTTLLDLRKNLHDIASATAKGEIKSVDELTLALIEIRPELLTDVSQNWLPPAQTLTS